MSPDCDIYCCHQGQKVMVGCMNTMLICQAVSSVVGRVKIGRTAKKVMWHCQTHYEYYTYCDYHISTLLYAL